MVTRHDAHGNVCCGTPEWRGALCGYHQGYDDGRDELLRLLESDEARQAVAARLHDPNSDLCGDPRPEPCGSCLTDAGVLVAALGGWLTEQETPDGVCPSCRGLTVEWTLAADAPPCPRCGRTRSYP